MLVLAVVYLCFQWVFGGIFSDNSGDDLGRAVSLVNNLFFAGLKVFVVIVLAGAYAGILLIRMQKAKTAGTGKPSVFSRGVAIALAVVAVLAALIIGVVILVLLSLKP